MIVYDCTVLYLLYVANVLLICTATMDLSQGWVTTYTSACNENLKICPLEWWLGRGGQKSKSDEFNNSVLKLCTLCASPSCGVQFIP